MTQVLEGYCLSAQQQRLWMLNPANPAFRVQSAYIISGRLDEPALERALRRLLDHHEILRTAFRVQPGSDLPLQVILGPPQTFAMRRRDLRGTPERAQQVAQLLAEERALNFDFEHGQVFHGCLATIDDEHQLLVLSVSALCADGVSLGKLGRDLHKLYETEVSSEGFAESAEIMQYADYAAWQKEVTEGADQAAGRLYWEHEEVNAAELQQKLVVERAEAPALDQEYRPEEKVVKVGDATWELLAELAHTEGVSVSEVVAASWAALIWRLSGEGSGVIIETSFDGRKYEELEEAIGNYESYLPLYCEIGPDSHYRQLLKVVSETVRRAQSRQEYFSRSRWQAMLPGQSESTSLGIGYSYEVLPESNSGRVPWEAYSLETCTERFKVRLKCVQEIAGHRLVLQYDPARLTSAAVGHLGSELATLLESVVRNPQQKLSEVSLLSEAEREQVLVEWNQTTIDYGPVECVHELFEQQVERTPEATALLFEGQRLSYRELNERANQLAHHLRTLGVGPEVLVGLCVSRSMELVVAVLGILKAGGAYVPLDAEYPAERLSFMVEDAGVSLLLTESGLVEKLPVYWGQTLCLDTEWETISSASKENLASGVSGEHLAYVIYTSGSTGQPKGVMIEQRGLVNYLNFALRRYAPQAGEGALLHSSLSFDLSVTSLYVPLLSGRCLELLPAAAAVNGLGEVLQRGTDYTLLKVTPAHLQLLNGQLSATQKAGASRTLVLGGENLTWEMIRSWREQAPAVRIYNEYGPTETVVGSSLYEVGAEDDDGSGSVPIGRPIANTQLYLLDQELEPVGVGVSGDLYIGGAGLARAYLNRGGLTAERFIPHPFSREGGARLYRTGDVARYLADGRLEYVGRADEQVKVRGYRIELGEVEAVLGRQWGVAECVVVARGEGSEKRLVAYVVAQAGANVNATELRTQLGEQLPSYMVPGAFVVLDQLPLTKNGKVNKRALPDPTDVISENEFVDPRTPVEELMVGIWREVLGVERISITDNFFELGGHSLLGTQLVSRIRDVFQIEIALATLFERPTVIGLAQNIAELGAGEGLTAPPLVASERTEALPLSFAQQRLWFLDQLEPNSAFYNNPAAVRLSGPLNIAALERTFTEITRRHESLRTSFITVDGEARQQIAAPTPFRLAVVDLTETPDELRSSEAERLAYAEAATPFDLSAGELLRVKVLRVAAEEHMVLLTMHHIVSDGWSMGVLIREVGALYQAYSEGKESPLEELTIQYGDYARWQREWLQGEVLEQQLGYWREQLAELPVLELPTDHVRPAVQSYRGSHHHFTIPLEVTQQLRDLSQQEGATLFMVLLAAFPLLLSRYSGQQDIVVGTDIAGRNRAETENLIGFFINQLVMRTDLSGGPTFTELVKRVREVCLGAYAHQDVPFEKLVEELQPERSLGRSPLFQVKLVLQNLPTITATQAMTELKMSDVEGQSRAAKYDLTLSVAESHAGLNATMEYNTDLFEQETVARMCRHLQQLLTVVAADPQQTITRISLLSEEESQQILEDWNATDVEYGPVASVHELFEQQVERTPDATALMFEGQSLSYRELNERANQLAHYLRACGVGAEVLVGLCLPRSIELAVGLLGILKAGGAYVPLDAEYPKERLSFMMEDAALGLLLTNTALLEELPVHWGQTVCLDDEWEAISRQTMENVESAISGENLAYVIYTSGSTGQPKGVMVSHGALADRITSLAEVLELQQSDRFLQFVSPSFDAFAEEFYTTLSCGAALVIQRNPADMSAQDFLRVCETQSVSVLHFPAAYWHQLTNELSQLQQRLPERIRMCLTGGESPSIDRLAKWFELSAAGIKFINAYGPTEAIITATFYKTSAAEANIACLTSLPIGRPLSNTQIYILDSEFQPVPAGVPGDLYIGGRNLARGYLNRPELAADRFVPDPFSNREGSRLYKTGDVACYMADGNIRFQGRSDNQVKLRGYRIELGEIEGVLNTHPNVAEVAVVLSRQDEGREKRLVAYVVADTEEPTSVELRSYLSERVPEYMIPSVFMTLEAFPLTPNGKIDHAALPAPEHDTTNDIGYTPARTANEVTLARIWGELLNLERVGIHDNFFELGGDSILSIQVVGRANQAGIQITPRQLFQHQTIAELAAVSGTAPVVEAEQGVVSGVVPLTPIQSWFLSQKQKQPHHYNQALLFELKEELDSGLLEEALGVLQRHHDALRMRFIANESGWEQVCSSDFSVPFTVLDYSAVSGTQQRVLIEETAAKVQASLDLTAGPIWRAVQFQLGGGAGRLLLVVHHLVVDGVSWRILLQDLQQAYEQLRGGVEASAVRLAAKSSSFKQWAERVAAQAQSAAVAAEQGYWQSAARRQVKKLPVDHEGAANLMSEVQRVTVGLSEEQTRQLLQEVNGAYNTQINDVLLAALGQAVSEWSGSEAVLVELEGHGREEDEIGEVDVTRTVGWFTSAYPALLAVAVGADAGAVLRGVKEELRGVPRRGLGYGMLRYLSGNVEGNDAEWLESAAQISFNYLGQLDQVLSEDTWLQPASESHGPTRSENTKRTHLLELNGAVAGGRLTLTWGYSGQQYEAATIERLAGNYIRRLQELIAHCVAVKQRGYTPSDFPLAVVGQEQIDELLARGVEIEDIYGLSPMQQGMLFHSLLEPGSGVYMEQMSCELPVKIDEQAFELTWQRLISRHTILRTSFLWAQLAQPVQVVHRHVQLPIEKIDWRGITKEEQQQRLAIYLNEERHRDFNFAEAPLMRIKLIRMSEAVYQFIWTFHHSLQDGWTGPLLLNEMFSTYELYCRGQEPEWEAVQPYRNYIAWLQRQSKEEAERYWRGQLAGISAPTPLRLGNSGRAEVALDQSEGGHHNEHQRHYSAELTEQLERYARQHQLTLNTLVQGVWALLLSRYSGTEEVVFGVTVSGRPAALAGVEEMVGLFINTLPLRVRVEAGAEVGEWLAEVQERAVEMRQYEYCSLVEVQGWSEVGRDQRLFESIVVFENYPVDETLKERAGQSSAISVGQVSTVEHTNYPLTIVVGPSREMWMKLSYDEKRFDEGTIERLGAQLERLLTGIVANPQQKLAEISLLSAAEREQAVIDWNQTAVEYGPLACVHELFEQQVERTPEATALVFEEESVSYRELNERANQLARYLRARGVGAEVPVAVCLPRSIELVVALWGILKAGGAYVPLDAEYPVERLNFMLADAGVSLLLTELGLLERLPVVADLEVINLDQISEAIGVENKENLENSVSGGNLAYIIYTSGSTGRPKGSMIHQYALANRMLGLAQFFEFNHKDRMLQCLSPSFDAFGEELFPTLLSGAALVLHRDLFALTAGELLDSCRKANVTTFHMAAAFWGQLVDQMVAKQLRFPESVRLFITGGESPSIERVAAVFAAAQQQLRFINAYGPTEAVVTATVYETPAESLSHLSRLPIGRPLINTVAYLLDEQMQPVPVGIVGELHLGGVSVARGYVNGAAITAERFIPDPFNVQPGARLYRTGDLGQYLEDGAIEFLGRIDEQVKVRGHRIELAEIETVLRQHEAVREVVVVGLEGDRDEFQLVAYAVLHAQDAATSGTLQQYLKAKLPSFMIPSSFVLLDQLPLTPNGKVDKRALPAPEPSWMEPVESYVAPRTPTEQLLASICAEVLGVERVGIQDNFFELGGHSLLATQFMLRAREAFQTEVPLRSLFESPTIAELAASIEAALGAGEGLQGLPLVASPLNEPVPLSFAQQRLWFLDQLEPNSAFYNIPAAVRLHGQLNLEALERTFTEIVRRHEALRTRFVTVNGEARQLISEPAPVAVDVTDLTEMAPELRDAEAIRLGKAEAARPFDLHAGDLLRVKVLRVAAEDHIVLLTLHHIISDGWSMNVLIKEVGTLYQAYSEGQESPLEELTIQYGDYARWQRQWMQGDVLEQQLGYWREHLAELPMLEMPADRTRPAMQSYRGKYTSFVVPADVTQQLRELSQQEGATLFMVLLAAFQLLLSRYSGQEDIVVGTDIAGRNREETESLIGFFVNTLVMRIDLSGGPTFRQLVQRVREVCLGAYAHQDVPFEKLVEELQPERDLSRQPLFQVMFEVQNIFASNSATSQLNMSHVDVNTDTAKFDLLLALTDAPNRLSGSLEYSTDLFDRSTVDRLVAHLQNLLAAIVKSPESSISELPILSEHEAQKQLYEWNKTEAEFPLTSTFSRLFEAQVERNPQSIAVVDRGEPFTYSELNVRANKLASALIAGGVGSETIVALLAERGIDLFTTMIAVWKAGGAYLPLDPLYPISRIAGILQQSKTPLVLTAVELRGKVEAAAKELEARERPLVREIGQLLASGAETENPQQQYDPINLAYVIYTSGSTGTPKGAMVEQQGMVNHLYAKIKDLQITADDRIAQTASQCFDISVWQFLAALLVGGQVYIIDDETAQDGRRLLQDVERYGLTLVETVPSLMRTMLDESRAMYKEQFYLSTLRCLVATGEALPVELCRQWLTKYPLVALMNAYGPTECSDDVTHHMIEEIPSKDIVRMPIGRPVSNMQIYILDKDRKPLPVGAVGELYVGGVGVGRGYLNDPIRTAEAFMTNPYSQTEGARLYRTGDVARYLADGRIEYVGRADEQVKVRGYRIELGEVETVLERQAGVAECVVVARGEESEKRLVAYVVAQADLNVSELRARLGEQLPGYMVPGAFVLLEEMPLTKNGKVDRRALPAPEESGLARSEQYAGPRTATEEILVGIWQSVLRVEQVGINDNFFELGGDSIISIQIIARANQAGLALTPRQLFQHQTIAELASVSGTAPVVEAEQGVVSGVVPLTPIQSWFFAQQQEEPHHYNQSLLFELKEELDSRLLEEALGVLQRHHDALRMRFIASGSGWEQVCSSDFSVPFTVLDYTAVPVEQQRVLIEETAATVQASLELTAGPVWRAVQFQLGNGAGRLLLVVHHLVVDGVSWRILLQDLQQAYEQLRSGVEASGVQLAAKSSSFKQWAERVAAQAQSAAVAAEVSYWQSEARRGVKRLPVDHEAAAKPMSEVQSVTVSLSEEQTRQLLQEVNGAYNTQINDLLLAALGQAVSEWSGSEAVLVELEGHGREEEEIGEVDVTRTVGWFTSAYPALLEVQTGAGAAAVLRGVKEGLRGVPRRGLGYGMLRYLSGGAVDWREFPEAEISFNYLGQLDQALSRESWLVPAREASGPSQAATAQRHHLLEINGAVAGGRLGLTWSYSGRQYEAATIERLATNYITRLEEMIAHCVAVKRRGYTPSDFPLAAVSQEKIDELLARSVELEDIYGLSPMQQGMLFHSLLEPGSGIYVNHVSWQVEGEFEVAAFRRAWQQVVTRHQILRTSFEWQGVNEPVQVVWRTVTVAVAEEDWRGQTEREQRERMIEWRRADQERGFDLGTAPLLRLTVVRLAEHSYYLSWCHHHLTMDGWCVALILREVFAVYEAAGRGAEVKFERTPPYREYIGWLQRQSKAEAERYWRGQLAGITAATPLRLGSSRVELQASGAGHHAEHQQRLSAELTEQLQRYARQHQLTLNTLVQGAWALLLSRYSGTEEVVFGVTVSGRPAELTGVEEMVGLFINTLPLRVTVAATAEVGEWLAGVQERAVEMRQYEYCSLTEVQSWSEVGRGEQSLFESIVVFENYPVAEAVKDRAGQSPALNVNEVTVLDNTNYPLTIGVFPGREMSMKLSYDGRRFDEGTIERVGTQLKRALASMVADPQQKLSEVSLISAAEREQIVVEWNQTTIDFGPVECVHELFEQQVERTPEATALVFAEQRLSYRELNERANQLAHYLRAHGVGREVRVAVCLPRSIELVVALLGIFKAGGAYVPLDAEYPAERISFMMADADVSLLLTESGLLEQLPVAAEVINLDQVREAISAESQKNLESGVNGEHLAYIIYTSGSTGQPKGVQVEHANLQNTLSASRSAFAPLSTDRMPVVSNFSFDISLFELLLPLLSGGQAEVLSKEHVLDMERLTATLSRMTQLHMVPSLMRQVVKYQRQAGGDVSGVRQVFVGGEAVSAELVRELEETFNEAEVYVLYGPTEATIICVSEAIKRGATVGQVIGRGMGNVQVRLQDRWGNVVPVGVVGELHIGGRGVSRGYVKREAETCEKFVEIEGLRYYRTGDLARYLGDGRIEYVGRADEQVKVRGFRIELGEVEAVLERQAGVAECVVVARGEEGEKRLVAYVVAQADLNVTELRTQMGEQLPGYMVPGAFVLLEEMPLTKNGKVDRRALPAPEESGLARSEQYAGPRTATEEILVSIWQSVLRVEQVGINDNFFELGGDSIISIQIIARANQAGLALTPRQLFQHQTIAGLAAVSGTAPVVEAEQGVVSGVVPLTPIQSWFFAQQQEDPHHFNQSLLFELKEELDGRLLEEALGVLQRHHDALRMRFIASGSGWEQVCSSDFSVPFTVLDYTAVPVEQQRVLIEETAATVQASLELRAGPVWRAVQFQLGNGAGRLLLVVHHLVVDGVSWRILLQDLQQAYEQLRAGVEASGVRLPAKSSSFKQWAECVAAQAQSAAVAAEVSYWQSEARRGVKRLPVDHEAAAKPMSEVQSVTVSLSEEQTRQLLQEVNGAYNTQINDLLLAALGQAVSEWSGSEAVLVELEGHGREEEEIGEVDVTRTVGWFTSAYPALLEVQTGAGAAAVLRGVKEGLRGVPRRGLGYGMLRYLSGGAVDWTEFPEAEISFNYLGQLDQALSRESWLVPAREASGPSQAATAQRHHLLEINGAVAGGRLGLTWSYSGRQYEAATIERLATNYITRLEEMIAHCVAVKQRGYTPSDFPLAAVSQEKIDELLARSVEIEDIYGLSPMQQGMLFHSLSAPNPEVLFDQSSYRLHGEIDIPAFKQAWQQVVNRHTVLRTSFIWEGLREPVQVVNRAVKLDIEYRDWRDLSPFDQEQQLAEFFRADRERSFDLSVAPLMRLGLLQLGESTYEFVWSNHHLVLDGWCLSIILKEVFTCYEAYCQGSQPRMAPSLPYKDYVAWLQKQDLEKANAYWQRVLKGFSSPTPLNLGLIDDGSAPATEGLYANEVMTLSVETTRQLNVLARQHQLTLNNLVQGAWALILNHYSEQSDVVFGVTVSGRPAELPGVETIMGPCINTLPIRTQIVGEQPLLAWLKGIQEQTLELQQHEYSSLVQQWSDVPLGLPLFESVLIFENYPMDAAVQGQGDGPSNQLSVSEANYAVRTKYPMTLVSGPGNELWFYVAYECRRFNAPGIRQMLDHLKEMLESVVVDPEQKIIDLPQVPAQVRAAIAEAQAIRSELRNASFVAPRTPVEEMLTGIAAQVLGQQQVGVHDNFFDLGGHSLLGIQLLSRIRSVFGIEVPLRHLFERPTVAGLAEKIEDAIEAGHGLDAPPLIARPRTEALPLSFAQQRLWFLDQLEPNSAFYNIPAAVRLSGALNPTALEQTFTEITRRHEALRTHFVTVEGEARQLIADPAPFKVTVVDLTTMTEELRGAEAQRLAQVEAATPFDLSAGDLLRVKVLRVAPEEHVVLLTMHHIISDGWSMGVLIREVSALYRSYSEGLELQLPELTIQYGDYARWQREWLQGEVLEQQLEYWREQLVDLPVLEIPADHTRPALQSYSGRRATFTIPTAITQQLKDFSQREGATLFMVLLAAFQLLLSRYSEQEDIVVGTAVAGRNRAETEGLIGCFVNTLVMRTDLTGGPTFKELVKRVREVCLGAYAHQEVPFEKLVEELQPERDPSRSPLVQVAFGLENTPKGEITAVSALQVNSFEFEVEVVRLDLTLWVTDGNNELSLLWTYNTDLFEPATIARMQRHFETLLQSILEQPGAQIHSLSYISEVEREEQLMRKQERNAANRRQLQRSKRKGVTLTKDRVNPELIGTLTLQTVTQTEMDHEH